MDQFKTALETESDMLEMAKTDKEDMVFYLTRQERQEIKGVVHTHAWAYAHLRTSAPNWLGIEENDVVWATASPGWQKWIWSPFLATLGSGQQDLYTTVSLNQNVFKFIRR